jgi:hypothetical protein
MPLVPTPLSEKCPIGLEVNGNSVEVKALEAIGSLLALSKKIMSIKDFITENLPEAGLYAEFDVQLMQGTAAWAWGWKEYKDHRAYNAWALNVDLALLSLEIEIGIGCKNVAFALQAFVKIDSSLGTTIKLERDTPDKRPSFSFPNLNVKIDAEIGARFTIKYIVKLEAKLKTGIELNGISIGVSGEDGFTFEMASGKFSGIKIVVSGSPSVGKVGGEKKTLHTALDKKGEVEHVEAGGAEKEIWAPVDEKELFSLWKFPKPEKYEPPFKPNYEETVKTVKNVFAKGKGLAVVDLTNSQEKWVPIEELAGAVASAIGKNDKIDPKTVELIAFKVRQTIESRYKDITATKKAIEKREFDLFCDSSELNDIIGKAQRPSDVVNNLIGQ